MSIYIKTALTRPAPCSEMRRICLIIILLIITLPGVCCTSVIVTAEKSGIGRPVMLKHRDTGVYDSKLEMFHGEHYDLIGLVNSSCSEKHQRSSRSLVRNEFRRLVYYEHGIL